MRTALLLVVLAACGDDASKTPDAGMQPGPDAAVEPATFASYVIDLITNGTSDTAPPRPYTEVEMLPDPDGENSAAFQSLF